MPKSRGKLVEKNTLIREGRTTVHDERRRRSGRKETVFKQAKSLRLGKRKREIEEGERASP